MVNTDLLTDILKQPARFAEHREYVLGIPQKLKAFRNKKVVLTGIATSLSAWRGAYSLLCTQAGDPPILINTSDLLDYDYPQELDQRPVFVMSRSGDSAEIVRLLKTSLSNRMVIGITEGITSALAQRSDIILQYSAEEKAFPNTVSFTLSQIYALAVAIGLGYETEKTFPELFDILETRVGEFGKEMQIDDVFGKLLKDAGTVLVDGQGYLTGVAEQYALDFHETRKSSIPVFGSIMRHGVIELTKKQDVITILLISDDTTSKRRFQLAKELYDYGKPVIVLSDTEVSCDCGPYILKVPKVPRELKSIMFTLGMQKLYISYIENNQDILYKPELVGKVTRRE